MPEHPTNRGLLGPISFCAAAGNACAHTIDFELFNRLTHKIVKVKAMSSDGSVSAGTEVLFGPEFVVTESHLTGPASTVELIRGEFRTEAERVHKILLGLDDKLKVDQARHTLDCAEPVVHTCVDRTIKPRFRSLALFRR